MEQKAVPFIYSVKAAISLALLNMKYFGDTRFYHPTDFMILLYLLFLMCL